jgi:two-component system C4-dicarboxylate transport sensor histidine kinase DctB
MSRSSSSNTWTSRDDESPMSAELRGKEALRLAELGLLTAGLIHELRQPVFALKALAQIAETHPARAAEYTGQVLAQVRTLEALIEGYADFSRRPVERREVFELASPVRSAMVVLEHRAVAARVRIDVELGPAVAVRGSMLAVQQAVVNLGQNAIDAVRDQAGGCLRILSTVEGASAVLRIVDNGPGLPASILANLFEPFHTTKAAGTGLGLSISRDLLASAGGELRLADAACGTCWEIVLPLV